MSPTAWVAIGLLLVVALFFLALPFLPDPDSKPPKHRRPSGDLLLDHSNDDDLEDWPGAIEPGGLPWRSAEPVSLPGDEGYVDEDLTLTERIEAEAVAERVIDNLRHIRETS